MASLKTYFPETDDATLRISFDALHPGHPDGRPADPGVVTNQLNVMKAIGAVEGTPDTSEGVLWTNKWNK